MYYTCVHDVLLLCHSTINIILLISSDPVPAALHLAFKAQRLHRSSASSPPLSVVNQLCSSASLALKTCEQSMSSDDHLNLVNTNIDIIKAPLYNKTLLLKLTCFFLALF